MYSLLRRAMFALPTETSHQLALGGLDWVRRLHLQPLLAEPPVHDPVTVMGLQFPNRVGLAAGLDKDAQHIDALGTLGFGFLEVGTVTPRPQPGNPRPRLFRLPEAQAIINRMGFNNLGVDALIECICRSHYEGVLGVNIGKNKDTPAERAVEDYLHCMRKVYPLASYITVNLSSPNTPGLRDLQFGEPLERLLDQLKNEQQILRGKHGHAVPLVVKIAPDLSPEDLEQVGNALLKYDIDGVIATNTTIDHSAVADLPHGDETGGLSGAPLTDRSTEVIGQLARVLRGRLPIIGVGGIVSGEDAAGKMVAGASLVQLYTGFIYRGPRLIAEAARACAGAGRLSSHAVRG